MKAKYLLHVGCGTSDKSALKGFSGDEWHEVRLDIDERVQPDIIGSLTDMGGLADASVDAVYSSHSIEHLYPHEVPVALSEFHRVLKEDGMAILTCPDLQSVCRAVADGHLMDVLYESPAGPISAIDVIFGPRQFVAAGNTFMAHRCGFTYASLAQAVQAAGFGWFVGGSRPAQYDLWLIAFKSEISELDMRSLASRYLP